MLSVYNFAHLLYVSQSMQVYINKNLEQVLFLYNIDRLQTAFHEDVNIVLLYIMIHFWAKN